MRVKHHSKNDQTDVTQIMLCKKTSFVYVKMSFVAGRGFLLGNFLFFLQKNFSCQETMYFVHQFNVVFNSGK